MAKTKDQSTKKAKGIVTAKIVWILGAVFFGIYTIMSLLSGPSDGMKECIENSVRYGLYFLAYVFGLVYLFKQEKRKAVFCGTIIYAVSNAIGFIFEMTSGSSYALESIVVMVLQLVVYVIFAFFTGVQITGESHGAYSVCLKLWYLPAALLLLTELIECFWTEFARPDGFLFDGFMVDFIAGLILTIPVFVMSRAIKERIKAAA